MVDALRRAHRALRPGGQVIDLHPTAVHASVEVGEVRTGFVDAGDAPHRHAAAARALAAATGEGLFRVDAAHQFTFFTYGDSMEELRDYVEENWRNARIGRVTLERTLEAVRADVASRPRIREHVQVTVLAAL
jgi:hypothetical protein